MVIYNRNNTKLNTEELYNESHGCTQAAINSDGCITLRCFNYGEPNDDEKMIVLSESETRSVFQLFRKIGYYMRDVEIPY